MRPFPNEDKTPRKMNILGSFEDQDLDICSYPCQLLVSIAQRSGHVQDQSPLAALHHWVCTSSSPGTVVRTKLGLDSLRLIHGFQDLDTSYWLYPLAVEATESSEACDIEMVHRHLTSLVTPCGGNSKCDNKDQEQSSTSGALSGNEAIISQILEQVRSRTTSPPQGQHGLSVQLFTITVLGNSSSALFTGGPVPVWKWVKPESNYGRQRGFWEPEFDHAVEDGEWNAGKGLQLLVQGVSEGTRKALVHRRVLLLPR